MSAEAIRKEYEERPSCLRFLYESSARQQLTDFFLELGGIWDEESEPLTKKDIIDATGMQRKSVIEHIDALIAMGVVNEVEGSRWTRYEPAVEKEAYEILIHANNVLGEHYESFEEQTDKR